MQAQYKSNASGTGRIASRHSHPNAGCLLSRELARPFPANELRTPIQLQADPVPRTLKSINMNSSTIPKRAPARLLAVVLMAAAAVTTAQAAAPALQGQISLRPLTPQEKTTYKLSTAQIASGLNTVAIGAPAYLDAMVNNAVPAADITNITWVLSSAPGGSSAALAASPLGTNVPPYKMADRMNQSGSPVFKVAGRQMLVPDVAGQYTVQLTIATASSGSGLGLVNIRRQLAARYQSGARLSLQAREPRGACANISIPLIDKRGEPDAVAMASD